MSILGKLVYDDATGKLIYAPSGKLVYADSKKLTMTYRHSKKKSQNDTFTYRPDPWPDQSAHWDATMALMEASAWTSNNTTHKIDGTSGTPYAESLGRLEGIRSDPYQTIRAGAFACARAFDTHLEVGAVITNVRLYLTSNLMASQNVTIKIEASEDAYPIGGGVPAYGDFDWISDGAQYVGDDAAAWLDIAVNITLTNWLIIATGFDPWDPPLVASPPGLNAYGCYLDNDNVTISM
jgi:hypothetical protein